jgi:hypothetical protein
MAATGRLFLNDKHVGDVVVKSRADSWGFGEFRPNQAFAEFAALFGQWSLLMHADDDDPRLSDAASEELRAAELAIDALKATLILDSPPENLLLGQLNIDGPLIEWKVVG